MCAVCYYEKDRVSPKGGRPRDRKGGEAEAMEFLGISLTLRRGHKGLLRGGGLGK